VPAIVDAAAAAAGRCVPFEVELGPPGAFPRAAPPRVVWFGLSRGAAALGQLAAATREELAVRAIQFDQRALVPHLTIARARGGISATEGRRLQARLGAVEPPREPFQVMQLEVMRSELSPHGPRYASLAALPLGQPGPSAASG
jgi:2'-5' RNA ligase